MQNMASAHDTESRLTVSSGTGGAVHVFPPSEVNTTVPPAPVATQEVVVEQDIA